jgi:hypothetical protein
MHNADTRGNDARASPARLLRLRYTGDAPTDARVRMPGWAYEVPSVPRCEPAPRVAKWMCRHVRLPVSAARPPLLSVQASGEAPHAPAPHAIPLRDRPVHVRVRVPRARVRAANGLASSTPAATDACADEEISTLAARKPVNSTCARTELRNSTYSEWEGHRRRLWT